MFPGGAFQLIILSALIVTLPLIPDTELVVDRSLMNLMRVIDHLYHFLLLLAVLLGGRTLIGHQVLYPSKVGDVLDLLVENLMRLHSCNILHFLEVSN